MGLLIRNELIWVCIPRCASLSIEKAFLTSSIDLKRFSTDETFPTKHFHHSVSKLYNEFGIHKTICIKRNWFDRWMSGLEHLFNWIEDKTDYTPIIQWEDINNEWIYNTFDTRFANELYSDDIENGGWEKLFLKFVKESEILISNDTAFSKNVTRFICVFASQNHWKLNKQCDYEFDISEMDKFSDFIYEKFGERLDIQRLNKSKKRQNKIIVDDSLKKWIWDKFEKPFEKRNALI